MDAMLIQEQPSVPPPASPGGAPAGPDPWTSMLPFLLIFVVLYFLLFRPQRKEAKRREQMISQLKKDDHVLTNGGLFGIIASVKDDRIVLRVDERNDIRIEVAKSAITGLVKSSGSGGKPKAEPQEEVRKK